MATIEIKFEFSRDNESSSRYVDIDIDDSLIAMIDDYAHNLLDEVNQEDVGEGEDEFVFDGFIVESFDDGFADPANFYDLDTYGDYVVKCEVYGEAYQLRYADIGEFDFDDQYQGCWCSSLDWAEEYYREHYNIPAYLDNYINWEDVAGDLLMDYSVYDGREGFHIFRD